MISFPKICIITVCYNSERTIEETIKSVIAQDYPNKEFIVIDGLSTDHTGDILDRYKQFITTIVSEKDDGIPDALNKGIQRASGEWIYFLSSDDLFYDDNVLYDIFSIPHEVDMVYGDVIMKTKGLKYDGEFDLKKILRQNICHQAQFYKRDLFSRIGLFDVNYKLLSDYDHTLRIFANEQIKTKYIERIVALFNDTGRTSFLIDKAFWNNRREIFVERFKTRLPVEELVKSYEMYFYQNFKAGNVFSGIIVLFELLYFTGNHKYINAAVKNLYYRLRGHD